MRHCCTKISNLSVFTCDGKELWGCVGIIPKDGGLARSTRVSAVMPDGKLNLESIARSILESLAYGYDVASVTSVELDEHRACGETKI